MSAFEILQNYIGFEEGLNGLLLKKIDGYLYTVSSDDQFITVCVHLPSLNRYQKKEIEYYLKCNAEYFCRLKFLKAGIKILFAPELLEEPTYITAFASRFSEFLRHVNIIFTADSDEYLLNKDRMYVFPSTEDAVYADTISQHSAKEFSQEVSAEEMVEVRPSSSLSLKEEYAQEPIDQPEKQKSFLVQRLSPTMLMLLAMLIAAVIFGLLCAFLPQVAAAAGYLLGSGGTYLYIKAAGNKDKLFLKASLLSLALLIFFGAAAFFYLFLSQTELYTIFEYTDQTLTLQYCIFNVVLGYILAVFGIYSSIPAKAKKKDSIQEVSDSPSGETDEPEDF